MAFEVVTSNPGAIYVVDSTDVVILPTGQLFTSSTHGFRGEPGIPDTIEDVWLQIYGQVHTGARGVDFWGSLGGVNSYNNNIILVGSTGIVSGATFGIRAESGANNQINNYGLITGASAIESYGGANSVILNGGTISGTQTFGLQVLGEVDTAGGPNTVITNLAGATISGLTAAIELRDLVGSSSISNHGMITSSLGLGIHLNDATAGQAVITVTNHGTVSGLVTSYLGSVNADKLVNRGQMNGDVRMSDGADTLDNRNGTINGDWFGGEGDDSYQGSLDAFVAGAIQGEAGNDTLVGGNNEDLFYGGIGQDILRGGGGNDTMYGDDQNDTLYGGSGDDTVFGGANNDEIYGGSGEDELHGDGGTDLIQGGLGNDTLYGGTANDTLDGGSSDDSLFGGANNDDLRGGTGDDELHGDAGTDTLSGGAGHDTLFGGTADDIVFGGSGDDALFGGANNDTLRGATGDDVLAGDEGNDWLYGGTGNDTLTGGLGADTLYGGDGADVFVFGAVADSPHVGPRSVIADFQSGLDRIDLSAILPNLTFIGAGAYSNTAGEVRFAVLGAVTRLYIDTTGNGGSNFSVDLNGAPVIDAGDLIL